MQDLYSNYDERVTTHEPEDSHRRTANDVEADRLIAARRRLLARFLPFVWLEDQNLSPAVLLETVAGRLQGEARAIRSKMYSWNTDTDRVDPPQDGAYDFHATV